MAALIAVVTLAVLTVAALVFVFQVLRQRRIGQLSASSFSTILLVALIGWMATEAVSDITGEILGVLGRVTHFGVMILLAAVITLQLRRSEV